MQLSFSETKIVLLPPPYTHTHVHSCICACVRPAYMHLCARWDQVLELHIVSQLCCGSIMTDLTMTLEAR